MNQYIITTNVADPQIGCPECGLVPSFEDGEEIPKDGSYNFECSKCKSKWNVRPIDEDEEDRDKIYNDGYHEGYEKAKEEVEGVSGGVNACGGVCDENRSNGPVACINCKITSPVTCLYCKDKNKGGE